MGMSVLGLGDLIYFADEPQPIFARPEPIIPAAELAQYEVWVVNMDQAARTRATDPVELEVEIGYRLSLTEAVQMKVWYAAPDWETAGGDGRLPIDGLGELFPLDPDAESVTITFSGNAAEMARIVGTRQPVLVVQLGIPPEGEAGTGRINMLLSHTFMDQVIELNHQTNE